MPVPGDAADLPPGSLAAGEHDAPMFTIPFRFATPAGWEVQSRDPGLVELARRVPGGIVGLGVATGPGGLDTAPGIVTTKWRAGELAGRPARTTTGRSLAHSRPPLV